MASEAQVELQLKLLHTQINSLTTSLSDVKKEVTKLQNNVITREVEHNDCANLLERIGQVEAFVSNAVVLQATEAAEVQKAQEAAINEGFQYIESLVHDVGKQNNSLDSCKLSVDLAKCAKLSQFLQLEKRVEQLQQCWEEQFSELRGSVEVHGRSLDNMLDIRSKPSDLFCAQSEYQASTNYVTSERHAELERKMENLMPLIRIQFEGMEGLLQNAVEKCFAEVEDMRSGLQERCEYRSRMDELDSMLDSRTWNDQQIILDRMSQLEQSFDKHDKLLSNHGNTNDELNSYLEAMKKSFDNGTCAITNRVEAVDTKIIRCSTEIEELRSRLGVLNSVLDSCAYTDQQGILDRVSQLEQTLDDHDKVLSKHDGTNDDLKRYLETHIGAMRTLFDHGEDERKNLDEVANAKIAQCSTELEELRSRLNQSLGSLSRLGDSNSMFDSCTWTDQQEILYRVGQLEDSAKEHDKVLSKHQNTNVDFNSILDARIEAIRKSFDNGVCAISKQVGVANSKIVQCSTEIEELRSRLNESLANLSRLDDFSSMLDSCRWTDHKGILDRVCQLEQSFDEHGKVLSKHESTTLDVNSILDTNMEAMRKSFDDGVDVIKNLVEAANTKIARLENACRERPSSEHFRHSWSKLQARMDVLEHSCNISSSTTASTDSSEKASESSPDCENRELEEMNSDSKGFGESAGTRTAWNASVAAMEACQSIEPEVDMKSAIHEPIALHEKALSIDMVKDRMDSLESGFKVSSDAQNRVLEETKSKIQALEVSFHELAETLEQDISVAVAEAGKNALWIEDSQTKLMHLELDIKNISQYEKLNTSNMLTCAECDERIEKQIAHIEENIERQREMMQVSLLGLFRHELDTIISQATQMSESYKELLTQERCARAELASRVESCEGRLDVERRAGGDQLSFSNPIAFDSTDRFCDVALHFSRRGKSTSNLLAGNSRSGTPCDTSDDIPKQNPMCRPHHSHCGHRDRLS